jgi:hypothetical protein
MLFNVSFNNISIISWRSVLLAEETGVPGENHRPVASHWQFYHIMLYRVHLAWAGFELATLVVKGTDYIGSCKSNYHPITTTTATPNHKNNHTWCNIIWTMRWKTKIKDHNWRLTWLCIANLDIHALFVFKQIFEKKIAFYSYSHI